jgi:hypothetical protein
VASNFCEMRTFLLLFIILTDPNCYIVKCGSRRNPGRAGKISIVMSLVVV